ncbi:hypothetical protein KIN34_14260 [Cellulomonas sp. DKR-3]|uniref:ANTAR domain-containing protein n=1 Tax=Cellulomonas fulva TaxID=2835530 RepID=A0ABS5U206_9CELL|nr:hypothetical protein [Cellulomonas fulva]MBT0995447.1 hypothetical protein [Cellulomonas fulva]
MSEPNVMSPRAAAARLGGLRSYGRTPDPADVVEAERSLATACIDQEMRRVAGRYTRLDDVRTAHLVGLLLANAGVKGDALAVIESAVRAAVEAAQKVEG